MQTVTFRETVISIPSILNAESIILQLSIGNSGIVLNYTITTESLNLRGQVLEVHS